MFIAIYQFTVKPDREADYEKAWHDVTRSLYEHQGSLGSRLHKNSKLIYLGYAQWPNKNAWRNSDKKLKEATKMQQEKLRETCEIIETLYELEVVDDLLVNLKK